MAANSAAVAWSAIASSSRWPFRIVFVSVADALTFSHTSIAGEPWQGLFIRQVTRTDVPPSVAGRRLSRVIEVGGTERTPGSLHISAPDGTSDLGLVLTATYPEKGQGFFPAMSRWCNASEPANAPRTVDATTVSDYRFRLDPNYARFDIPDVSLPDDGYNMVGPVRVATAGTYRLQSIIQTRQGGVTLLEDIHDEAIHFPVANDWILVDLGVFNVPTLRTVWGSDFRVALRVHPSGRRKPGAGRRSRSQDAWLFPTDEDCLLTSVC